MKFDPAKYPLTTQSKLSESSQAFIDAHNLDQLREMIELGEPMSDRQKAILKELEEKHKIRSQENPPSRPYEEPTPEPPAKETEEPQEEEEEYRGDPRFRLTKEQSERVAREHREMMALPMTPPIDMTRKK